MRQVPESVRLAYALPALALAVVGLPVYVHVPKFYTDVVGLQASGVGLVVLVVRLTDALTDPVFGKISDSTHSIWGRRRPYIALGSFPLALMLCLLFNPPHAGPLWSLRWFTGSMFLVFLFWTAVEVPYEALGPEITLDYDERTRLLGARDGFVLLGILLAVILPVLIQRGLNLDNSPDAERTKFMLMAWIYAPSVVLSCWVCALVVPERNWANRHGKASSTFWRDLRRSLDNRPFVILLSAYTISSFGSNLPATLILYYVQYVLESARADAFLLMYFVTGILFLPLWILLARRVGKKASWLSAMAVNTGAFAGVFFLGPVTKKPTAFSSFSLESVLEAPLPYPRPCRRTS